MKDEIITKVDTIEFLNIFFTDKYKYSCMTDKCKMEHCFSLYRKLTVRYPLHIVKFEKIHDVNIMNSLHETLCTGVTPQWCYTKLGKSEAKKVHYLDKLDKQILISLNKHFDFKDTGSLSEYYDDCGEKEIKALVKMYKEVEGSKTTKKKVSVGRKVSKKK